MPGGRNGSLGQRNQELAEWRGGLCAQVLAAATKVDQFMRTLPFILMQFTLFFR
jgi:hypothetical protein